MRDVRLLWVLATCLMVGAMRSAAMSDDSNASHADVDFDVRKGCGADCLAYVGRRLHASALTREAAQLAVDSDGDGICSIADLTQGFHAFGIDAVALHSDLRELPEGVAVLLLRTSHGPQPPSHFVVIEEENPNEATVRRLFVPSIGLPAVGVEKLVDLWGGDFIKIRDFENDRRSWAMWLWSASVISGCILGLVAARAARK